MSLPANSSSGQTASSQRQTASRGFDHLGNIARTLGDLQGDSTVVHELIQNADDAPGAGHIRFTIDRDALTVWNDGEFEACSDVYSSQCEWLADRNHRCDFHSFREPSSGDKANRSDVTGAFGVGFTAVYQLTDLPELISSGVHWWIDETAAEAERITGEPALPDHAGTTFVLPWAYEPSAFRQALKQEPLNELRVERFYTDVLQAVPVSMPFLRKVECVDVVRGSEHITFRRSATPGRVVVTSSDGRRWEWRVVSGDFAREAAVLKTQHGDAIGTKRSHDVTVAFALGADAEAGGLLYATLPSSEPTHLPLHINADFVPASDRKRIRFDESGPAREWNRAAIECAAHLVARSIAELADDIDDLHVVRLILATKTLQDRSSSADVDTSFASFWNALVEDLPQVSIVPAEIGGRFAPKDIYLWDEAAERDAAHVLSTLGVHLVAESVRNSWYQLRGTPLAVRRFDLAALADALLRVGLDQPALPGDLPQPLAMSDALEKIWAVTGLLLEPRGRSNDESRRQLSRCALAPARDGRLWPAAQLHRAPDRLVGLLASAGVAAAFLDDEWAASACPAIASLVPELRAADAIRLLRSTAVSNMDEQVATGLLRWFSGLQPTDAERAAIAALPIFPTDSGSAELRGLALPGDFVDPLGLATLVRLDPELHPFLRRLGAKSLDFSEYCVHHVAPRIRNQSVSNDQLLRFVALLALKLSSVQDNTGVRTALQPLALVPCTDGQWRIGADTYLSHGVTDVLGDSAPIASVPPQAAAAASRSLFEWLGAVDRPRPADVVARCEALVSDHRSRRQVADRVLQFLKSEMDIRWPDVEAVYQPLTRLAWLPAEDHSEPGFSPSGIYSAFSRSLFESQGTFLDVPVVTQQRVATVLEWLGVQSQPAPLQVVKHLLWMADRTRPVGRNIWDYLNRNSADSSLDRLMDAECLFLEEVQEYVAASRVYSGSHPFGSRRYTLASDFRSYSDLLTRLEVKDHPDHSDAIAVLHEIAREYQNHRWSDEDKAVAEQCWQLLANLVSTGLAQEQDLKMLRHWAVVPDATDLPRRPTEVVFRGPESLVARFEEDLRARLINRPENLWRALQAAGVVNLADGVETVLASEVPAATGADRVQKVVLDRRLQLARVLISQNPNAAARIDDFIRDTVFTRLGDLQVSRHLQLGDREFVSDTHPLNAAWIPAGGSEDSDEFCYVDDDQHLPEWTEIAAELTQALGSDSPAFVSAIRDVLRAPSKERADRELDALGFPNLDVKKIVKAEVGAVATLGGAEVIDEALDDSAQAAEDAGDDRADSESAEADRSDRADSDPETSKKDRPADGSSLADERSGNQDRRRRSGKRDGPQRRLRSYVLPKGSRTNASIGQVADPAIDRAGVAAVLAYEVEHGRQPVEMPHSHPGYDVESVGDDGLRYIEVKSSGDVWAARGVALSSAQFAAARNRGDDYWLYVVEHADTEPEVHPIRNPWAQIDQYFFDDDWRDVSERDERWDALPPLPLPTAADGLRQPVPVRDMQWNFDGPPIAWMDSADESWHESWFAVRITGEVLGLAMLGGVAIVVPVEHPTADEELVLVRLHDQIDPLSNSLLTIRYWDGAAPDEGHDLYLASHQGVNDLLVEHPGRAGFLGRVVARLTLAELEGD